MIDYHKLANDLHQQNNHTFLKKELSAFLYGGCLAVFAQVLKEFYQTQFSLDSQRSIGLTIITLILITALLTGFGIYDRLAQRAGAGLFIPITGFANSLVSCALEGKSEGFIYGIGSGIFKLAGSVLTYGVTAAFVLGSIRFFLGGY